MLRDLLHDMYFAFADPRDTGCYKLKGGGKSAWGFHGIHAIWSSLLTTTMSAIRDISAATTKIDVSDGNGLIETVSTPMLQKPSHTFSTPMVSASLGKSWLFMGDAE